MRGGLDLNVENKMGLETQVEDSLYASVEMYAGGVCTIKSLLTISHLVVGAQALRNHCKCLFYA